MISLLSHSSVTTLASLTIRKLDEAIKAELRLRAARHGRSVEDEVRVILREASQGAPSPAPVVQQAPRHVAAGEEPGITLIIGGGIAAYKALDLIRRLKE